MAVKLRFQRGDWRNDVRTLEAVRERVGDALELLVDCNQGGGCPGRRYQRGLRRVAILAQEHHLVFTPHTWTNGMGLTANTHLVAGLTDAPFLEYPYDPPEWSLERRDFMLREPLRVDAEGWITLSDALGMGYALDEGRLLATRIG